MKKIVTRYSLLSIIISLLMSACSEEEIDGGGGSDGGGIIAPRGVLSFGEEYDVVDDTGLHLPGNCYVIVDGEANRLELKLYDPFNDYAPIENFKVIGVSIYYDITGEYTGAYKTIDEIRPGFHSDFANGYPELDDPDSFAHADLGEGKTHHHIHNWFNIQDVDGDDEKIIITIPANDTGHVRGFRLLAGKDMGYGWDTCELEVYQCPQETESIADKNEFPMSIRYKGKVYTTMATVDENDEYHYDNPEFAEVMRHIDTTPGIDAVVMDDKIVDYFDEDDAVYQEFLRSVSRPIDSSATLSPVCWSSNAGSRANGFEHWDSTSIGYYAAYSDGDYKGAYLTYMPKNMHNSHNLRDLKMNNMNDKISSVALYYGGSTSDICAVLTVWEDGNYNNSDNNIPRKKHRISFIASYNNRKVSRASLKDVKLINASGSWNDRISSLSYHFAYLDRPLKDY